MKFIWNIFTNLGTFEIAHYSAIKRKLYMTIESNSVYGYWNPYQMQQVMFLPYYM